MDIAVGIILFIIILVLIALIVLYFMGVIHSGQTGPTGPAGINATGSTGPTGIPGSATWTGATGPTGSSLNTSYITFNSGGNYVNNAFQFFGSQTMIESSAQIVIARPGRISNLVVSNTGAKLPNGDSKIITVRVNGQNTPLIVQMYAIDTFGSNNTDIVNVNTGDRVSVQFMVSDPNTTYGGSITFSITS